MVVVEARQGVEAHPVVEVVVLEAGTVVEEAVVVEMVAVAAGVGVETVAVVVEGEGEGAEMVDAEGELLFVIFHVRPLILH